jgi:large subunit ribosomal protein L25
VVVGEAADGAVVSQALNTLSIQVLPLSVPESIEVSVEGLQVGDVIRAGEIALPDGVTLVGDPEDTAVSVTVPDADPDAEAAEDEAVAEAEGAADETAEEAEGDAAAADEGDEG